MNTHQPVKVHFARPVQPPQLSERARELEVRLAAGTPDRALLRQILSTTAEDELEVIRQAAERAVLEHRGAAVSLRGLIEFSNRCTASCYYCGIRRDNKELTRYQLSLEEIVGTARWCAERGYGSIVLQSGERRDAKFTDFVTEAVRAVKDATRSEKLPQGLGITLCVGEQSSDTYAEWFEAGAHRYLLRIETSSPRLFAELHPATQKLADRMTCLRELKRIGYRLGTGVLIGVPGQLVEDLVDDLFFFRDIGADMLGMGPYVPHKHAVLPDSRSVPDAPARLGLALRMIAAARLLLPDINIAATTALQTLAPDGREQGLRYGANVVMPQATPSQVRSLYMLYDDKPCLEDSAGQCAACIEGRIASVGRDVLHDEWGDAAVQRQPAA